MKQFTHALPGSHSIQNGVPAEFSVTTAEWLAANNFQALPVLIIRSMAAFGYGDFRQVPIVRFLLSCILFCSLTDYSYIDICAQLLDTRHLGIFSWSQYIQQHR